MIRDYQGKKSEVQDRYDKNQASFQNSKNKKELEQLNEKYLRSVAEMENMRKRFQREREEIRFRERETVIREVLPVLDSIERALSVENAHQNPWFEGFQQIYNIFMNRLKQLGVTPVPGQGSQFDPNIHEALSVISISESEDGTIHDVIETGYQMNEQLIRPAKVIVVKNRSK